MWICRYDETENPDDVLVCPVCGNSKEEAALPSNSEPAEDRSAWTCPKCGRNNSADTNFCGNCGTKREETPPVPEGWTCSCGAVNDEQYNFCKMCGKARKVKPNPPEPKPPKHAPLDPKDEMRRQMKKLTARVVLMQILSVLCIVAMFVLFSFNYTSIDSSGFATENYTIYKNVLGVNGSIEQLCSIVLIVFTLLPLPFLFAKFDINRRNLPLVIAIVSACCITLYALTIFFGVIQKTIIPILIVCCAAAEAFCAYFYVDALKGKENILMPRAGDL